MPTQLRVMVLFGGRSAEHEVSLRSARFIVESLDPNRFTPILVGIDKQGRWHVQEREALAAHSDPRRALLASGQPEVTLSPWPADKSAQVQVHAQPALDVDVVFPVLHGPMGEDGTVQGLLELAGLPYVGAGVLASAVGMDKDVMKRLLLQADLPVLPYRSVRKAGYLSQPEQVLEELAELAFPVFVKPANLGSSVGISRVLSRGELRAAIEQALQFDDKVVVEQGLDHPKEIECAVLQGTPPVVSVPGEIVVSHPDGFYSYAAKYLDDAGVSMRIPADLSAAEVERAQQLALRTFEVLDCEGMARVDLFLDHERRLFVNEINTIPGFTSISMYPKLMEASGVSARELVTRLIDLALRRAAEKKQRLSSI
ncbi:MAG TPA: D-alanine--D-alanine ligase family protein [Polyangiaceae bacterium]|nr:D-alanine--D-alanine ligase family protein [Polyangiaceae bacterium]